MRKSVYRDLMSNLLEDCRSAVAEFAVSRHNRHVYAFILDCDPFHGDVVIGINTEEGIQRVVRERFPNAKPSQIEGFHGIRFSGECFAFSSFSLSEESQQLLDEIAAVQHDAKTDRTAERHADTLLLHLVRVLLMLDVDLAELDQTENFVAFVSEREAPEASRVAWVQRTVSPELFERVFPEMREFEDKLATVALLPPPKRASFWVQSLCDLVSGVDTTVTRRLNQTGVSQQVVIQNVVELGSASVGALVDALETSAYRAQLSKEKAKASKASKVSDNGLSFTPSCAICLHVLEALRAIRLVDQTHVQRIHNVLKNLLGKKADGPLPVELAKTLHTLRPRAYPCVSSKGHKLVNAADYLRSP